MRISKMGLVCLILATVAFVSSDALGQTRAQCQARCKGSGNPSQCVEDCILSSKTQKQLQMAPVGSGMKMRPLDKACPAGWTWSQMKGRCINIGQGGVIR